MIANIGVYEDVEVEDTKFTYCGLCTICCQEAAESLVVIRSLHTETT